MIGAILTGGYGKRMQGFSQDIPKNLLELGGTQYLTGGPVTSRWRV